MVKMGKGEGGVSGGIGLIHLAKMKPLPPPTFLNRKKEACIN